MKTDEKVSFGQMKRNLNFGKITVATVHGIDWRGTIMRIESSVRKLLQNSKQEIKAGNSKIQIHEKLRGKVCKI